jgi:hypothetical protein
MPSQHPTDPAMIDRRMRALLDNARQFASRKRMRKRQPHDMLLDMLRQALYPGRLGPHMGQEASID